jgi:adenylate kinase
MIGVQGSGKGTQSKLLEKEFGWLHITTGELLRRHITQETPLGIKVKKYIDQGNLVPDEDVYQILHDELQKAESGFILDGFPRNLKQLQYLSDKYPIDNGIHLKLSDQIAIERMLSRRICIRCNRDYNLFFMKNHEKEICEKCGGRLVKRDDDEIGAIKNRLQKFHQETNDVIEELQRQNILIEIDANDSIDNIHQRVLDELKAKHNN